MLVQHNFRIGNSLLTRARKVQAARLNCYAQFPKKVFRDTAWDILLELLIADQEGRKVCVKEVAVITGESSTGAIRRLDELEEAGLISRRADQFDQRRKVLSLSATGYEGMLHLLDQLFDQSMISRSLTV